eukprot:3721234-Rhodomonas_salina.1
MERSKSHDVSHFKPASSDTVQDCLPDQWVSEPQAFMLCRCPCLGCPAARLPAVVHSAGQEGLIGLGASGISRSEGSASGRLNTRHGLPQHSDDWESEAHSGATAQILVRQKDLSQLVQILCANLTQLLRHGVEGDRGIGHVGKFVGERAIAALHVLAC